MTLKTKFPWWVYLSLLATILLSLINLLPRVRAEESNKAVGIFVEYDSVEALAAGHNLTMVEALKKLKAAGVNGISLNEMVIADLLRVGQARFDPADPAHLIVLPEYRDAVGLALDAWDVRAGAASGAGYYLTVDPEVSVGWSIGLDPVESELVNQVGFYAMGRYGNREGLPPRYFDFLFADAVKNRLLAFLPLGNSVPGFKTRAKEFRERLKSSGIHYAAAEFVKTAGNTTVIASQPENTIKLHTAQTAELERMDLLSVTERYGKAFEERNCRILLVRPMDPSGGIEGLVSQVKALKKQVEKAGGVVRMPRPFDSPERSPLMSVALGLACLPAMVFLVLSLFTHKLVRVLLIGGASVLSIATYSVSLAKFTTLFFAIGFIVLAYQWLIHSRTKILLLDYALVSLISLTGGLQVAGQLIGLPFMLQADQFMGVKMQMNLPILIVFFVLLHQYRSWREVGASPVKWASLGLGFVILGALAFMNARTGNENPAAVSGLELQIRDLLDRLLVVRPRTKEFMIGHPMLVVGLGFLGLAAKNPKWQPWAIGTLTASVIGQASIVNTMCHLHTPVELSLVRVAIGLASGCILGFLVWGALNLALIRKREM